MNGWGWRPGRVGGIVRAEATRMRAFAVVVPLATVGLLLLMFHIIGGTLTTAKGVLFDLPATGVGDAAVAESVALLVPMQHETTVFFDDSRYVIGSEVSMRSFEERLSERFARSENKTLLVLADRRVPCGDLMGFSARARRNGVEKVLFAEKNAREASE